MEPQLYINLIGYYPEKENKTMADIITLSQEFNTSSSLSDISGSLSDSTVKESNQELKAIYILKEKIDELITEVNVLKNK